MNPGPLLAVYLVFLAYLSLGRRHLLLFVWIVMYLALPFLRNKYGPVSIYWSDVAAIATCIAYYRPARSNTRVLNYDKWYLGLGGVLFIGVIGTVFRYQHLLEPTYLALRNMAALLPIAIIPRVVRNDEAMKWVGKALVVSAVLVGSVAIAQTLSRDLALTMELLFSGGHELTRSAGHLNRLIRIEHVEVLRAYGMYGSSTAFAGATALMGFVIILFRKTINSRALVIIAISACFSATLLTYSRHGLLALLVFASVLALLQPRRVIWLLGVGAATAAVASFFVSNL